MGLDVLDGGRDRVVKSGGCKVVEGDATGGAAGGGFGVEFGDGAREERDDRQGGIFGADFLDVVQALEIPGVDVDCHPLPAAASEGLEEIGERIDGMDVDGRIGLGQKLGNLGPRRTFFPEEQDLKENVWH